MVIDADGLNIVASRIGILGSLSAPAVLTPHPGEFGRLLGIGTQEVLDRKLELAPKFAEKRSVVLVLKGHRTLIAAPDGRILVNPTGNPGMATGGSGDVLAGMIASEIMQSGDVLKGTAAAVFAHGLSGDLAAEKLSQKALTAGDLIRFLPAALKALESE
jgi:NAD(P)H-hydrate epimerase